MVAVVLLIHPEVAVAVDRNQDCIDLAEGIVHVVEIALETAETVQVGLEIVALEIGPETADAAGIALDVEEIALSAVEEIVLGSAEETDHVVDWDTVLETEAFVHYVEEMRPGLVEEGAVDLHEVCHRSEGEVQLEEHWAHSLQNNINIIIQLQGNNLIIITLD